jgi:hypothetical protein
LDVKVFNSKFGSAQNACPRREYGRQVWQEQDTQAQIRSQQNSASQAKPKESYSRKEKESSVEIELK